MLGRESQTGRSACDSNQPKQQGADQGVNGGRELNDERNQEQEVSGSGEHLHHGDNLDACRDDTSAKRIVLKMVKKRKLTLQCGRGDYDQEQPSSARGQTEKRERGNVTCWCSPDSLVYS